VALGTFFLGSFANGDMTSVSSFCAESIVKIYLSAVLKQYSELQCLLSHREETILLLGWKIDLIIVLIPYIISAKVKVLYCSGHPTVLKSAEPESRRRIKALEHFEPLRASVLLAVYSVSWCLLVQCNQHYPLAMAKQITLCCACVCASLLLRSGAVIACIFQIQVISIHLFMSFYRSFSVLSAWGLNAIALMCFLSFHFQSAPCSKSCSFPLTMRKHSACFTKQCTHMHRRDCGG